MKKQNRLTASYVRKFLPGLRRVFTAQGRKWTVNGTAIFDSLQELVRYYGLLDKGYVKESSEGGDASLTKEMVDHAAHAADHADREMGGEDASAE